MPRLPPVKRFETRSGVRIYRIACNVLPDLSGRVYLLLGAGPPTLVDAGSDREPSAQEILKGLDSLRSEFNESIRPADVRRIVITHGHIDHIGGLGELLRHTEAVVGVHPLDRHPIVDYDEHVVASGRLIRGFFHQAGVPDQKHSEWLTLFGVVKGRACGGRVDFLLEDGQELDGLRIIHTPGHSPGHVCILADDVLLCADHILPVTVPQQWPESTGPYNGLGHYLESLEKVRRIEGIALGLGGHEMPIEDVYARIEQLRQTQLRRLERVLDLVRKAHRPPTVCDLAVRMYTQAKGIHAVLAVMDAGSRAEYLYQRGELALANLDEVERDASAAYRYRMT